MGDLNDAERMILSFILFIVTSIFTEIPSPSHSLYVLSVPQKCLGKVLNFKKSLFIDK